MSLDVPIRVKQSLHSDSTDVHIITVLSLLMSLYSTKKIKALCTQCATCKKCTYASLIVTVLHAKNTLVAFANVNHAPVRRAFCISDEAHRAAGNVHTALNLHFKPDQRQTVSKLTDLQARFVLPSSLRHHMTGMLRELFV